MIYLQKNSTNNFVLTLSESSRISDPFYLFQFRNEYELNSEPFYFTTPDISSYPCRYNQFVLTESTSGSTTGGTSIDLSLVIGQYEYKVYEATGSTLSISGTTGRVLEIGRMVVASNENTTLTNNNSSSIYI